MKLTEAFPIEAGENKFGLEIDVDNDIDRNHNLVGQIAVIADHAIGYLCKVKGKKALIKGVIIKFGQIAGFEVEIDGKILWGPTKNFLIRHQFVEDIHLYSPLALSVKHALRHWSVQRNYFGPSLDGIEFFCYQLAKSVGYVGIEFGGWCSYPSSLNAKTGRNWRYVIPDNTNSAVMVNCHSMLYDDVWSLSTTVHGTRDIVKSSVNLLGSPDFWERVLVWCIETAIVLQADEQQIAEIKQRLVDASRLREFAEELKPVVAKAMKDTFNESPKWGTISLGFSHIPLSPASIGVSVPSTDETDYTIISVHPRARKDWTYCREVVRHELIHAALGSTCDEHAHGERFQALAMAAGLPEKYRD